jgi:hypothetical protein
MVNLAVFAGDWARTLNSSHVARIGNSTFGAVGGKGGEKRQQTSAAFASK